MSLWVRRTSSDEPRNSRRSSRRRLSVPIFNHKQIVLGHGSGGKLTSELIQKDLFAGVCQRLPGQTRRPGGFAVSTGRGSPFTTDAFVVTPIFFPGGDIGDLAINGTVNDLAMSGAKPLYIAAAFILGRRIGDG